MKTIKKSQLDALIKECVNEVTLEEGMLDRLKARASGVAKGASSAVKGGLDKWDASWFKQPKDKYNAAKNLTLGKNKYTVGKISSYKKTAESKLNKVANEIMTDMKKLGIDSTGVSAKQINFFKSSLSKALSELISKIPTGP